MPVLAKLQEGDFYPDLESDGFAPGPVIICSKCDCEYRVFYSPEETPASVVREAADIPSLDEAVERSHPQHGENRIRVGTQD